MTAHGPNAPFARSPEQAGNCPIARSLDLLGRKWTLLVVRESLYGTTRFDEFQRILRCPRNVLSDRLSALVDAEILDRVPYHEAGRRERHEYHLTDKGRDLSGVMLALLDWGDRHAAQPGGPPVRAEHVGCGETVKPALRCAAGHPVYSADQIRLAPGPGALVPTVS